MENAKYYTPTIDEFHVGFEYEHDYKNHPTKPDGWEKEVFSHETRLKCISDYITEKRVRVKRLDRVDIEGEGWVFHESPYEHYSMPNSKYNMENNFNEAGVWDIHVPGDYDGEENHFKGTIRNASELRKIMKMLNIP